jgi:hypothetical protein
MALTRCPECGREVSDKAHACPGCGYPLPGADGLPEDAPRQGLRRRPWPSPFEYKSRRTVFGLPLLHVVSGPAWAGGLRPARGFIAIGNVAIGVIAIGGFGLGLITFAGIGLGAACFAGIALGIGLGVGGLATGYLAVGGLAIGVYAVGGLALGTHTLQNDPQLLNWLRRLLPK